MKNHLTKLAGYMVLILIGAAMVIHRTASKIAEKLGLFNRPSPSKFRPMNVTVLNSRKEKTTTPPRRMTTAHSLQAPYFAVPKFRPNRQLSSSKPAPRRLSIEMVDLTILEEIQKFEDDMDIRGAMEGLSLQDIHRDIEKRTLRIRTESGLIYGHLDRPIIHGLLRLSRMFTEEDQEKIASRFTMDPDREALALLEKVLTREVIFAALTHDRLRFSLIPHEDGMQLYGITLVGYTPLNKLDVRRNLVDIACGYFPNRIMSTGIRLDKFERPCEIWLLQLDDHQMVPLAIQYCLSNGYAGVRIGPPNQRMARDFGVLDIDTINIGAIDWRHNQDPEELYSQFHKMIAMLAEFESV